MTVQCENLSWGAWIPKTHIGKKYLILNANPEKKRGKLWLNGEWISKENCRKWTEEEINQGWGNSKKYGKLKLYPIKCGKCDLCRLARANEWVTRIMCEQKISNQMGVKIDLTYAPKHVPEGYVLKKADYQSFLKRLRIKLKRKGFTQKIKYFIGGEYGPEKGRPHYHIIIIGWQPEDMEYWKDSKTGYPMYKSKFVQETWGMGICTLQPTNSATISYATRYTNKKAGEAKTNAGVPEFQCQSQGIGKKYWELNKEKIIENLGIWIKKGDKANCYPIPRYFKKMWKLENPIQYEKFNEYSEWQMDKAEEIRKQKTDLSKIEYIERSTETAKIIYKTLKRRNLETQQERLDIANNNGYNIRVTTG